MVVKIQKMFVWMCVFCKFIATANKAFTNGKILRKTVNDKNIAKGIEQGGRSCAGARVAPAQKFGLGQKS